MDELPTMLTVAELARILRVDRATIERICERGHVHAVRTPGGMGRLPVDAAIAVMREMGLDEQEVIDAIRVIARRTR